VDANASAEPLLVRPDVEFPQLMHLTTESRSTPRARPRVTLSFRSERGRQYLYDDKTGIIFPWTQPRESALKAYLSGTLEKEGDSVQGGFGQTEGAAAIRFVRKWTERYGAFVRTATPPARPPSAVEAVEWIRRSCTQLTLILTEDCNLRCRYCVFSGLYKYWRVRSWRQMPPELAIRAIDWFASLVSPQLRRNPRARFGLTFYGGEPLLNMVALKGALEHARQKYPELFAPTLTTNGVLLTEKAADLLASHQVHVVVSLDGPQAEHDRERVDSSGRGTHARILENLKRIRQKYPQYWKDHVVSSVVCSYKSDLEAICDFFEKCEDTIPPCAIGSIVDPANGTYWQGATRDDYKRFIERMRRLRDHYNSKIINNLPVDSFSRSIAGHAIICITIRNRLDDPRMPCLPYTGACHPGHKIAVEVDGTLNICERVDGTFPIGRLGVKTDEGIDGERVRSMIDQYQRMVLPSCGSCCVTRICDCCLSRVLAGGVIFRRSRECANTVRAAKSALRDYVSIMEANPNADLPFLPTELR